MSCGFSPESVYLNKTLTSALTVDVVVKLYIEEGQATCYNGHHVHEWTIACIIGRFLFYVYAAWYAWYAVRVLVSCADPTN